MTDEQTAGNTATTTGEAAREAARQLWRAWRNAETLEALPQACRPATRAQGYAVQSALLTISGSHPYGWKIAATSEAGQAHIGVAGPLGGRLFADRVHASGATVSLAGNRMRVAEVEFAFRMSRTLAPRATGYELDEVLDAVDALLPAIEIPDSRYGDFARAGAAQLIADNACAWHFVAGAPAPAPWRTLDLATHTVRADVGDRYLRDGIGRNVLGDPRTALAWLANELSTYGLSLEAGEVVTTGTCLAPLEIQPGDHLLADFGHLGQVEVTFGE